MRVLMTVLLLTVSPIGAYTQDRHHISFGVIGNNSKTSVTINELLRDPRMVTVNDSFTVLAYEVMIKSNATDMMLGPYKVQGAKLTQEVIDVLKANRKSGGTIYFENITVADQNNRARMHNSFKFQYRS